MVTVVLQVAVMVLLCEKAVVMVPLCEKAVAMVVERVVTLSEF